MSKSVQASGLLNYPPDARLLIIHADDFGRVIPFYILGGGDACRPELVGYPIANSKERR